MKIELKRAGPADIDCLIGLMRRYYEHDRIDFDEPTARGRLHEIIGSSSLGWLWLIRADAQDCGYAAVTKGDPFATPRRSNIGWRGRDRVPTWSDRG